MTFVLFGSKEIEIPIRRLINVTKKHKGKSKKKKNAKILIQLQFPEINVRAT